MQDKKDRLNIVDFEMLLYMARGYRFFYVENGIVGANLRDKDGFYNDVVLYNSITPEAEQNLNNTLRTDMLNNIEESMIKSNWKNNKTQIEALYDEQNYDQLWQLLSGHKNGNVLCAPLFNKRSIKNFIKYNDEAYVFAKEGKHNSNVKQLEIEKPYTVYDNDEVVEVDKNPFERVIKTVYSTKDLFAEHLMYDTIYKNTFKGMEVDPKLYSIEDSMQFWRTSKWRKQLASQRKKDGRAAATVIEKAKEQKQEKQSER